MPAEEPQVLPNEVQVIEQAIDALQTAVEFSEGKEEQELQGAIAALSVAIEFV